MSLEQLLYELSQRGVKLSVEDNQLRIRAPKGTLTPEHAICLAHFREDVLKLFSQTQPVHSAFRFRGELQVELLELQAMANGLLNQLMVKNILLSESSFADELEEEMEEIVI